MASEERVTYCRICEPLCGLVATVRDGELVKLRPDRDHPLSQGFACPKGIAMTGVQNDPDRVTHHVGANPLVSHGSVLTAPRIKEALQRIVARGGRVVVVDPRRSETARAFEHVPIRPDSDAWMLLSMLHVIFADGLADREAIDRQATGVDGLRELVSGHTPEETEARTAIPAARVRELERDLATAGRAAVYGSSIWIAPLPKIAPPSRSPARGRSGHCSSPPAKTMGSL